MDQGNNSIGISERHHRGLSRWGDDWQLRNAAHALDAEIGADWGRLADLYTIPNCILILATSITAFCRDILRVFFKN